MSKEKVFGADLWRNRRTPLAHHRTASTRPLPPAHLIAPDCFHLLLYCFWCFGGQPQLYNLQKRPLAQIWSFHQWRNMALQIIKYRRKSIPSIHSSSLFAKDKFSASWSPNLWPTDRSVIRTKHVAWNVFPLVGKSTTCFKSLQITIKTSPVDLNGRMWVC